MPALGKVTLPPREQLSTGPRRLCSGRLRKCRLPPLGVDDRKVVERSVEPPEIFTLVVEEDASHSVKDGVRGTIPFVGVDGQLVVRNRRFGALRRLESRHAVDERIACIQGTARALEGQAPLKELGSTRRNGTIPADEVLPHMKGVHLGFGLPRLDPTRRVAPALGTLYQRVRR